MTTLTNDEYLERIPEVVRLFRQLYRLSPNTRRNLPVSRPDLARAVVTAYYRIRPPTVPRSRVQGVRTRYRNVLRGNGIPLHLIF